MKKIILFSTILALSFGLFSMQNNSISANIKAGDFSGGTNMTHINIAAFYKLHGQENFQYPNSIKGSHGALLTQLEGKAHFIFINHTSGLKNKDVILIGNDVLRENAGKFEDFGVDAQLTVEMQDKDVFIAGMVQMLMVDDNNRVIEHKGFIKKTLLPKESIAGWKLVYNNKEDGIAIYANEDIL